MTTPCPTGKIQYPDKGTAQRSARAANAKRATVTRHEHTAYWCPTCHSWHLTSQGRRRP